VTAGCYPCQRNAEPPAALPSRERVYDDGLWRVAHSFNSALAGWMVVIPRRHVGSLGELTAEEASALGPLLSRLSRALEDVLGVPKAYVAFFAEQEGFAHVHLHVVPRPDEHRGPAVFEYLLRPEPEWTPPERMDEIAERVRERLDTL
jgi:diadenosine tetraphosphate (Ap4A) HIT family hydrolase